MTTTDTFVIESVVNYNLMTNEIFTSVADAREYLETLPKLLVQNKLQVQNGDIVTLDEHIANRVSDAKR